MEKADKIISCFKEFVERSKSIEIDDKLFVPFSYGDIVEEFIKDRIFGTKGFDVEVKYGDQWKSAVLKIIEDNAVPGTKLTVPEIQDYLLRLDGIVINLPKHNKYRIFVKNLKDEKNYMTLMHEYAHIELGHFQESGRNVFFNFKSIMFNNNNETLPYESDADEFAINFAMPKRALKYLNETKDISAQGKAEIFKVSPVDVIGRERKC